MNKETVTISLEEYNDLYESVLMLEALESAGVDNWAGIDYARELYQEMSEEAKK